MDKYYRPPQGGNVSHIHPSVAKQYQSYTRHSSQENKHQQQFKQHNLNLFKRSGSELQPEQQNCGKTGAPQRQAKPISYFKKDNFVHQGQIVRPQQSNTQSRQSSAGAVKKEQVRSSQQQFRYPEQDDRNTSQNSNPTRSYQYQFQPTHKDQTGNVTTSASGHSEHNQKIKIPKTSFGIVINKSQHIQAQSRDRSHSGHSSIGRPKEQPPYQLRQIQQQQPYESQTNQNSLIFQSRGSQNHPEMDTTACNMSAIANSQVFDQSSGLNTFQSSIAGKKQLNQSVVQRPNPSVAQQRLQLLKPVSTKNSERKPKKPLRQCEINDQEQCEPFEPVWSPKPNPESFERKVEQKRNYIISNQDQINQSSVPKSLESSHSPHSRTATDQQKLLEQDKVAQNLVKPSIFNQSNLVEPQCYKNQVGLGGNQLLPENIESIVGGTNGFVTSTFGNKRHSRGNGSISNKENRESTDLRVEDTLGISQQVQQMIANRKRISMDDQGQSRAEAHRHVPSEVDSLNAYQQQFTINNPPPQQIQQRPFHQLNMCPPPQKEEFPKQQPQQPSLLNNLNQEQLSAMLIKPKLRINRNQSNIKLVSEASTNSLVSAVSNVSQTNKLPSGSKVIPSRNIKQSSHKKALVPNRTVGALRGPQASEDVSDRSAVKKIKIKLGGKLEERKVQDPARKEEVLKFIERKAQIQSSQMNRNDSSHGVMKGADHAQPQQSSGRIGQSTRNVQTSSSQNDNLYRRGFHKNGGGQSGGSRQSTNKKRERAKDISPPNPHNQEMSNFHSQLASKIQSIGLQNRKSGQQKSDGRLTPSNMENRNPNLPPAQYNNFVQQDQLQRQNTLITDSLEGTHRGTQQSNYKKVPQEDPQRPLEPESVYQQSARSRSQLELNKQSESRLEFKARPQTQAEKAENYRQQVSQSKKQELACSIAQYIKLDNPSATDGGYTSEKMRQQRCDAQESSMSGVDQSDYYSRLIQPTEQAPVNDIVQENLKKFLTLLEHHQLINIQKLEQDSSLMSRLVEDIKKFDFNEINNPNFLDNYKHVILDQQNKRIKQNRSVSGASHMSHNSQKSSQISGVSLLNQGGYISGSGPENNYNTSGAIHLGHKEMENSSKFNHHQQYFSASQTSQGPTNPTLNHMTTTATSAQAMAGKNVNYHYKQGNPDSHSQKRSDMGDYGSTRHENIRQSNPKFSQSLLVQNTDSTYPSGVEVNRTTSATSKIQGTGKLVRPMNQIPTSSSQLSQPQRQTHVTRSSADSHQPDNLIQIHNSKIQSSSNTHLTQQEHFEQINKKLMSKPENDSASRVISSQNQVAQNRIYTGQGAQGGQGSLQITLKQKRGGSHEEQKRDRMKQLLGGSQGQSQPGHPLTNRQDKPHREKRCYSNARSIHRKEKIMDDTQLHKINESIVRDRTNMIRYLKLYTRKNKKIPPTTLQFYSVIKQIGKGAFGEVWLAFHKLTGKEVAIKLIEKDSVNKDDPKMRKIFQEVYILKKIRHSNIIRLYEVFETQKHLIIVMEYAGGGDLYQLIKSNSRLTEDEAKYIFKKVAQGVAHCHCRSVLHRDIKLDNILLDGEGGVKICDFGVSRLISKQQVIQEQCGTPAYLAPEMASNSQYSGFFVDIWSLGIMLYAMLQGTVPFKAESIEKLYECQIKMNIKFRSPISEEAKNLICRMLVIKPQDRISLPEILCHPWLQGIIGPDGIPEEDDGEDESYHNFMMSLNLRRDECNMNPQSVRSSRKLPESRGQLTERCSKAIQRDGPHQHIANINVIDLDNLFPNNDTSTCRLSYNGYCAIVQDYGTYQINEDYLRVLESFGFSREMVKQSLNRSELNHATCTYNLLAMQ